MYQCRKLVHPYKISVPPYNKYNGRSFMYLAHPQLKTIFLCFWHGMSSIIMPNYTDMSIPIVNDMLIFYIAHYYCTVHFSVSKGTVTTDTTDAMRAHNYDNVILFHTYKKYHSSSRQHYIRACGTHVICALTTRGISLYAWNNITLSGHYIHVTCM